MKTNNKKQDLWNRFKLGVILIALLYAISKLVSCDNSDGPSISEGEQITDIQGNLYRTVHIGKQQWMVDNLKTQKFSDNRELHHITNLNLWFSTDQPSYCSYQNEPDSVGIYGYLYNWHAVNSGKLCPEGWEVPTRGDWMDLVKFLSGPEKAGGKLKDEGTDHWASPNLNATNESKFGLLPGGYNFKNPNSFGNMNANGFWWTATEFGDNNAYAYVLFYNNGTIVETSDYIKEQGLSVCCIKKN
jgi:uncharacterized protein (TIGR02145 family)